MTSSLSSLTVHQKYAKSLNEDASSNFVSGLAIIAGFAFLFVVLVVLFVWLNRSWRVKNTMYLTELKRILGLCQQITGAVPVSATSREEVADLVQFSRTTASYEALMAGEADLLLAGEMERAMMKVHAKPSRPQPAATAPDEGAQPVR